MLFDTLNNLLSAPLRGKSLPTTAAAPAQANAAARAAQEAEAQASQTAPAGSSASTTPGVIFDLSEAALQAVAGSSASNGQASTIAATAAVPQVPPSFPPAGVTIAAEIAAVTAPRDVSPQAAAVPTSTSPALSTAGTAASAGVQEAGTATSSDKAREAADPDEEARARAHAIQAQERNQVLSLVEQLSEAKAEPLAALTAPAEEAASDNTSTHQAA
ncbi:hypothetical protein [Paracoccus benzoatiresistens]|uniref:Flagellar hook-length control protein FliK n=1 Tax=Paracoccus benzoatiresistens TaxID=2997341 RepID=A0ABT4J2B6_9RHOB|nr:hypothetical protein [Paracoccus sp. EF6]MCZ0960548.1 hypothetical protein [Paracoccus sp. EF6]